METLNNKSTRISCPQCAKEHQIDPSKYKERIATLECSCNKPFQVLLVDSRQHVRKAVNISALCSNAGKNGVEVKFVTLQNMSEGGASFSLLDPFEDLEKGKEVTLTFELLNGGEKDLVITRAEVRSVDNLTIGCSFAESEKVKESLQMFLERAF